MIKLNTTDKIEAANQIALEVLEQSKSFLESDRKKAKEIFQLAKINKYFQNLEEVFPTEESFAPYLSFATAKEDSIIVKSPGKHGYYLSKTQQEIIKREGESLKIETKVEKKEREKEKVLYPAIERWLQLQKYRTKDTSNSKKLGKWGNPDITGIKFNDFLDTKELEITTIEAKISIDNWEYNIFEAVSHRRFANRAYFAFAHPYGLINSLPSSIRYYCEIFSIGLIIVGMSEELYKQYLAGNKSVLIINEDDYEVTEIYSAPFNTVRIKYQREFCIAMEIKEVSDYYSWGSSLQL